MGLHHTRLDWSDFCLEKIFGISGETLQSLWIDVKVEICNCVASQEKSIKKQFGRWEWGTTQQF